MNNKYCISGETFYRIINNITAYEDDDEDDDDVVCHHSVTYGIRKNAEAKMNTQCLEY